MPTLTQPAIGNTGWGTDMNNNLQVLQNQLTNAMQGRMHLVSATQVGLKRYTGDTVEVNGLNVSMGSLGIALNTTDNLIDSTGADAGAAMGVNTLYYVYLSNSAASPFPSQLRGSATAPATLNGVPYLGSSGNAACWRFVGYVRTVSNAGTPNFADGLAQRLVINFYNRIRLTLFTCPAYADDGLQSSYSLASTTWVALNGGVGSRVEYIANGEDCQHFAVTGTIQSAAGKQSAVGLGIDSTTTSKVSKFSPSGVSAADMTGSYEEAGSVGYHTADILGVNIGGTSTVFADDVRRGSASDPFITYLSGSVFG